MNVKLISHTPNPDFRAGQAAAICVGGNLGDVVTCSNALKHAMASGHMSVAEHACFSFRVEGISRVTLAQLTRHRVASFSVESQRYVENSGMDVVVPDSIAADPEIMEAYETLACHAGVFYANCIKKGIPAEDARYGFLQGGKTRLTLTMNARELLHLFSLRCCNRAQWEIRELTDEMLRQCKQVAPELFANAGPGCVCGRCPEAKPCDEPRDRSEWE